ncbi:MAG: glycosyl hydrolase [Actinomycetota bacterium]
MPIDPAFLGTIRYRCIGPTRGGRVMAVAGDPDERSVFYFGAVAGGVWRTDDAGTYWECITDGFLTTSSIGALAVAESDPNVIYAGTGESTIRIDVSHGDGVYRSRDRGATWTHVGLEESRHIGKILVHPDDPDLVYVAALGHASKDNPERGVYRSTDGGDTWELVLHVSEQAGAVDLSLDPSNPRRIFATTWETRRTFWSIDSGGPGSGLWRTDDGGDTWTNLSENPGLPDGTLGKIGVAVSPAQRGRVWAMVEAEGRKRGLYRSDDHGDTWVKTSGKAELAWRPWYYMHVVAHPTDANTVFVLDMKAWKSIDGGHEFTDFTTPHGDNHGLWIDPKDPDRMIGADDGGAWVSLTAGNTWSSIYNQPTAQFYHLDVDDQFPYMVYGSQQDNSSIAVPSRTGMGAITWGDCYPPGTAESGYVAVKPGDPNIVFVGAIGSSPGGGDALQRYDHRTKQIRLVTVWPERVLEGNTAEVRFQWTYPIMFSPHDSNELYAAGNKLFRSRDEGESWEPISPDLTRADPATMGVSGPLTMDTAGAEMYATIFSLMVSAHRRGVIMTGSDDGLVHVSTDDGATWDDVTPEGLPANSQVTMLAESPHTEGTVYMTVARHKEGDYEPYVFKTTDLGRSWAQIGTGLPEGEFCRVVREDPDRPGLLYVGTELGLHISPDDGVSWQPLQANLPVTPIYDLMVKHGDLIVATHGRSFWIMDDVSQIHQAIDLGATDQPALMRPRDTVRAPEHLFASFWGSTAGKNYHVTLGQNATFYLDELETGHKVKRVIDAGEDLAHGVRITYHLPADVDDPVTLSILDADGDVIEAFTSDIPADEADREGLYCTANPGMNSFWWSMLYPPGPKMTGSDFHGRPGGPLAMPGAYTVKLEVGDWSSEQPFALLKDPRIETSDDDLQAQFDLRMQIQDRLGETTTAINRCRDLTARLADWAGRLDDIDGAADAAAGARTLSETITAIEHQLVQPELKSDGDTLNYREQLWEKLADLVPVVASADARPTAQSYAVFEKLSDEIDPHLSKLDEVIAGDLAALNDTLTALGVDIIGA